MSFTYVRSASHYAGGASTSVTVTMTIPSGAVIGFCGWGQPESTAAAGAGSVVDNNSVSYSLAPNNLNIAGCVAVAFYSINSAAATSLTWTPPTATGGYYNIYAAAWVFTPSAGTVTNSGGNCNQISSDSTTANAVTTGNMTITSADAMICGLAVLEAGPGDLSAGTVPSMTADGTINSNYGYFEHAAISSGSASPATWTDSVGGHEVNLAGIAFSLSTAAAIPPLLPLLGVGVATAPLAWVIRRRQQRARELRRWKRDNTSGLILPDYKRTA